MDEEGKEFSEGLEGSEPGINRRRLLQRATITAGGLWAAPAILSLSRASAHHQATPHAGCGGQCCPGQNDSCFNPNPGCFCDEACQTFGDCCPDFDPSDCPGGGSQFVPEPGAKRSL